MRDKNNQVRASCQSCDCIEYRYDGQNRCAECRCLASRHILISEIPGMFDHRKGTKSVKEKFGMDFFIHSFFTNRTDGFTKALIGLKKMELLA